MATRGQRAVRRWMKRERITFRELGDKLGDLKGDQCGHFVGGRRPLPMPLAVSLAELTGVPLGWVLTKDQRQIVSTILSLSERDAA